MALHLLKLVMTHELRAELVPRQMKLMKLVFRDIDLAKVEITGPDAEFGPLLVPPPAACKGAIVKTVPDLMDTLERRSSTAASSRPAPITDPGLPAGPTSSASRSALPLMDDLCLQPDDLDMSEWTDLDPLPAVLGPDDAAGLVQLVEAIQVEEAAQLPDTSSSDGDDVPPQPAQQPSAEAPPPAEPVQNRWAGTGVSEKDKWRFYDTGGRIFLGVLHQVGPAGLKATCKLHRRCVCWLTSVPDVNVAEADLVRWFAGGQSASSMQHQEEAARIKTAYGMRVRNRK